MEMDQVRGIVRSYRVAAEVARQETALGNFQTAFDILEGLKVIAEEELTKDDLVKLFLVAVTT